MNCGVEINEHRVEPFTMNSYLGEQAILWLDTESGGLSDECDIHQIGGLIEICGRIVSTFIFRLRPFTASKITSDALEMTQMTHNELWAYQDPLYVYTQFLETLERVKHRYHYPKLLLAGHSIKHDIARLGSLETRVREYAWNNDQTIPLNVFERLGEGIKSYIIHNRYFCTHNLMRKEYNQSYSLQQAVEQYQIKAERYHTALEDARLCREVSYKHFKNKHYESH